LKTKNRNILLLSVIFIITYALVLFYLNSNKNQRINAITNTHLEKLKTHYEVLLYHQKVTANASYQSTIELQRVTEILAKAYKANEKEKNHLRQELYNLLINKYNIFKTKGVLQYQFVLPNNISFLRMHKPSRFGDSLKNERADFVFANKNHRLIRGFEQGKTAHGFRHVYPIFDKNGNHVGAMEISFSSEVLQDYLTKISKIHTHFLVDKSILKARGWDRDDLVLNYKSSAEHNNYMITMTKNHTIKKCIEENKIKIAEIKDTIKENIKKEKAFSLYITWNKRVQVISFYPIKNIQGDKNFAWLVSYEYDDFVMMAINSFNINSILSFFHFVYNLLFPL
jgi:hypothetical protein